MVRMNTETLEYWKAECGYYLLNNTSMNPFRVFHMCMDYVSKITKHETSVWKLTLISDKSAK